MTHLQDKSSLPQAKLKNRLAQEWPGSAFYEPNAVRAVQQKVDQLASHMQKQLDEHEAAMRNTHQIFEQLLQDLDNFAICFQEAFKPADSGSQDGTIIERVARLPEHPPDARIRSQADPDRSVGILNILWHAISFTTRGNTKPLALARPGRPPLFTGRIIAFNGDFLDSHSHLQSSNLADQLHREVASLYVPSDPSAPAVMQIKHLHNEEIYFHQADAARRFLLKVVEIICGGGFFHEQ
jgi:hypothetical protein